MNYRSGTFKSHDGMTIFEQSWVPKQGAKAVVIIVHGFAEHSTRYTHVAEHLLKHGYAVETFDLRGHGKSFGKRTFVQSFDEYLHDLDHFFDRVRDRHNAKSLFLLGHSMGGAIAALYEITRKPNINGLILSAATLKISDDISPFLVKISKILGSLFPKLPTIKLKSSGLSRDLEVVKKYDSDPLVYRGGILAKTGAEITRATKMIQDKMESISLPVLILHGTADKMCDPEGSKQFYACSQAGKKTLKLYEGLLHEIMNEPENELVFSDIVDWLDEHSPKPGLSTSPD